MRMLETGDNGGEKPTPNVLHDVETNHRCIREE